MDRNDKRVLELLDEKIEEFVKTHGRDPGPCEVREIKLEIERKERGEPGEG